MADVVVLRDMEPLRILGVIGARAGSKTVPDKNIRPLLGKPLFAWIADAAKESSFKPRVIMSTDSVRYQQMALECGIEVPFLRPAQLAADSVPDFDYLFHAADWMEKNEGWKADIILRLPPTTPLCTPDHIDGCIRALLSDPSADSSRTIVSASKHPYKLWRKQGKYIEPFLPEEYTGLKDAHNLPRQSFPGAYSHVDVIALRWKTLMEDRSMAGKRVVYYEIPKDESIDIDTEVDFLVAEYLLKRKGNS